MLSARLSRTGRDRHAVASVATWVFLAASILLFGPSAQAISSRTLFAPTGAAAADRLGASVGTAGDVNGDRYADVIVGVPFNDAGGRDAGRAHVYFGGPGADANPDLTFTGAAADDVLGYSVGTAGDVNGDRYADVIVGAYGSDAGGTEAGRAYVYFGGPGADATADLTLTGAAANDHFGYSVGTAGDVNEDGYADVIVGAYGNDAGGVNAGRAYVYFGGPGADATPDLTLTGAPGDQLGISVGVVGDVNGDGYTDLIAGAPFSDAGGTWAGRAYVYFGGPGADATPDLTFTGAAEYDQLGISVGVAGDVSGDGYADVIVGAYGNDAGGVSAGRAYVHFGGPGADATPDLIFTGAPEDHLGSSVGTAGDVDGDGYADVIVGAYCNDAGGSMAGRAYVISVFPYQVLSPNGGEQWVSGESATVRWRGHDVADLGISLDGGLSWRTLAVGIGGLAENEYTVIVPDAETDRARVRLVYQGLTAARTTSDASDGVFRIVQPVQPGAVTSREMLAPTGAAPNDNLGASVGTAGDVNGDGYDDVIVGAPYNDSGGANAGRAYVYFGGPGADVIPDLTLTGAAANDYFGYSVGTAGDVNGDRYADVIVGAPYNDSGGVNAGRAYVFFGGPGADATPDLTLTGAAAGDYFGCSVGTAGDVNEDRYADVIVGAFGNDAGGSDAGRAYVYYGGPGANTTPDLTFTGAEFDNFGYAVGTAGDLNGDGYADVIVGAPFNGAGAIDAGRAYVYFGGPAADATPDLTFVGVEASGLLGYSVGTAGDVDGDGYSDVIVGVSYYDAGGSQPGRANVYYGGPGADASADLTLTGAEAGDNFGTSVGTAGDVNGDGYADLVVGAPYYDAGGPNTARRTYVYYGGPGADATPDLTFSSATAWDMFGYSVGTAGDVNGDGYDDIVVGAYHDAAGGAAAGRAYVYDINRYFVLAPDGGETWNVGAERTITWLGSEPADVWLSVDGGGSYELLDHAVGGSAMNAVTKRVPHLPTKFAMVRVTPADTQVTGSDQSDSLFTIQTSIALLGFGAEEDPEGGTLLSWSTNPAVGPEGISGYRLYRVSGDAGATGTRLGPELIAVTQYTDRDGGPGSSYRLSAVNGLGEELELGQVSLGPVRALWAWPLPFRGKELHVSFAIFGALGARSGTAEVGLYDLSGRLVKVLAQGSFTGRQQTMTWDGRDGHGSPVAAGVYFLRAQSGGQTSKIKLTVVR